MKIVVVGCGRTGATLARALQVGGHDVTVVDRDPEGFARLGGAFAGRSVAGHGLDRRVLEEAGVAAADGLAAVTGSDELNVVIGRAASTFLRVPRVVARVYEPGKAAIYRRLGLQTIAPVTWGAERMAELLTLPLLAPVASLGAGQVDLVEVAAPEILAGRRLGELEVAGEVHPVALTRSGSTSLAGPATRIEAGDLLHLAVMAGSAGRVRDLLGLG